MHYDKIKEYIDTLNTKDLLLAQWAANNLDREVLALLWISALNTINKEKQEKTDFIELFTPISKKLEYEFQKKNELITELENSVETAQNSFNQESIQEALEQQKSESARRSAEIRHSKGKTKKKVIKQYWGKHYINKEMSNQEVARRLLKAFDNDNEEIQAIRQDFQLSEKISYSHSTYVGYVSQFKQEYQEQKESIGKMLNSLKLPTGLKGLEGLNLVPAKDRK